MRLKESSFIDATSITETESSQATLAQIWNV